MPLDKKFYINTGKDGILADTTPADVQSLVDGLPQHPKLLLHFHGGLVSKNGALASAQRLLPQYQAAGAYPVFFAWESNFISAVSHNLHEINKEAIFKALVKMLVKFTVGKLLDLEGGKSTGQLQLPTDIEVAIELKKADNGAEPYAELSPAEKLRALNDAERTNLEAALTNDPKFQQAVNEVVATAVPEQAEQLQNAKGILTVDRASAKTLMSPNVVEAVRADVEANAGKGLISTAVLIKQAGEILVQVVNRFIEKRDHGVYCTVVEEILRQFYLANVGESIWNMMKKETADAFQNAGKKPERGGWFFIDALSKKIEAGYNPEITLVGHSAGSIYIYHLLKYVEQACTDPDHPLPADFQFKNIILEAPAIDMLRFADMVKNLPHLFENFRMFTMNDEGEKGKAMVPVLYPRSLLYFVSGVLEKDYINQKKLAYDQPLAGMQRYYLDEKTYDSDEIITTRNFIFADDRRVVWANENRGDGLASAAVQHSGYAEEPQTLASVKHIVQHGWA